MTRARAAGVLPIGAVLLLGAVLAAFALLHDSPESLPEAPRSAGSVGRPASAPPGSSTIAGRTEIERATERASAARAQGELRASEALPGDPPSADPEGPAVGVGVGGPARPSAQPSTRQRAAVGVVPSEYIPPTEDDVVERFRDTYGDPDPERERQMIDARRESSLQIVEGLMAGLAEQEEAARRAGEDERADQLARSVRRLEWRHQVLDREPGAAAEPAEEVDTPAP